MKTEHVILRNLIGNQDYSRKTLPYFKEEYFTDQTDLIIFRLIRDYSIKYSEPPALDVLLAEVPLVRGSNDDTIKKAIDLAASFAQIDANTNTAWLKEFSEKWVQERAVYLAVTHVIEIIEGNVKGVDKGVIPEVLREALGVSFDVNIGHDYFDDWEARFEARSDSTARIPFDIHMLNVITNGGLPPKTLSVIAGGTNTGKTLAMCSLAAGHLAMGYDVLYVTFEMSSEMIGDRLDANALDCGMELLYKLQKDQFKSKVFDLRRKTMGKLVIKEYPNKGATPQTIRSLISELSLKKKFRPQVVYVDYLNICASARKPMKGTPTHEYVQSVAEELRALGQEENLPVISATQLNREGFGDSDPDMDQIAQSFGLPQTVDFMVVLVSNDQLAKLGQYICKQLKSRLGDKNKHKAFVLGVDYDKMRLYDVDQAAYDDVGMKDVTPPPEQQTPQQKLMARKPKPNFKGFSV